MNKKIEVEIYVQKKLKMEVTESFLTSSIILLIEDDPNIVRDILVLIPNTEYGKFVDCYGPHFVVDDHDYEYPVFTKFRNLEWMKDDLKSRLSIALWIYQNSLVIQDPQREFVRLLNYYQSVFQQALPVLIKHKYIEMRTERHNLRQAISRDRKIAIPIIKATVAKLAMEISLLADNQPYPYKKWLPEVARNSHMGRVIYPLVEAFLGEKNSEKTIVISEEIIESMRNFLSKNWLSSDLLNRWWLYLK
ncbi:DUF4037 domain-containing protein [Patescibacteria group bacterium]|nr:DUF4037 domain-containing protein [Patescibacteria group bacterium]MBU1870982.1 DUF4037 domain-containing protein [Patescibacteria group bacterium]